MTASNPKTAFKRAVKLIGSQQKVAEVVGVSQPSVCYIVNTAAAKVPAEWCLPVERATDGAITRHQLRPDLYPKDEDDRANGPSSSPSRVAAE